MPHGRMGKREDAPWKEVARDLQTDGRFVGYVSLFGVANLGEAKTAVVNALVLDRFAALRGAVPLGMPRLAAVRADEDVLVEVRLGHGPTR